MKLSNKDIIRFNAKVTKTDGCWLWPGRSLNNKGYGQLVIAGKKVLAHRVSYTIANGAPPASACLLHSCDTPLCVNPAHLRLGTRGDNHADMHAKGRYRPRPFRLSVEQRAWARELHGKGYPQKQLAIFFGVSFTTMSEYIRLSK